MVFPSLLFIVYSEKISLCPFLDLYVKTPIKEALNKTVNGLNNLSTHLQQIEQRLIVLEESKIEEIEKIRELRIQLENQLKKF